MHTTILHTTDFLMASYITEYKREIASPGS